VRLGVLEYIEAGHIRQRQVQQQNIHGVLPQLFHGFATGSGFGRDRKVGLSVDQGSQAGPNDLVVVHDHDSRAIHGPGRLHNLLSYFVHVRSLPL
jgi:hypothetical protein